MALFNAAYEGYVIPFRLDEAILRFMVDAYDLDLYSSRVAFSGDEAVASETSGCAARMHGSAVWASFPPRAGGASAGN